MKRVEKMLAATVFMAVAAVAVADEVDGIAAKVGVETILKSDVELSMKRAGAPEREYENFLNHIIENKLILKAAGESKMTMQEWVVESRIQEIIQRSFDGDRNKLMDQLARDKISYPEWCSKMKEDMIVQAMRWQVVDKNITARPIDMRKEYAEHAERYTLGGTVSVSVITLAPKEIGQRNLIDETLKTKTFESISKQWKDIVPEENFGPAVCRAINELGVGETSEWITIEGWSFKIRKNEQSTGKTKSFVEAFDEIEANVKEAAALKAYNAWINRLKEETYIKIY